MSGWMTPFDGSGVEWHEGLPSPYTYQESDFSKLVAAVHEYEAALLEARAENARAVGLLREIVKAWERDAETYGHAPLPGDAAVTVVLALGVDPFLAELDGDPYFAVSPPADEAKP